MKIEDSKGESSSSEVQADSKEQLNNDDSIGENEDDLEEGELRDDDDDEEEEDVEAGVNNLDGEVAKPDNSSSSSDSPVRPPSSSSSSSSSSSDSKEQTSSKSSSKIGSHHSSSSRNNNLSNDRSDKPRLSSSRHISEDRFRVGRDREKEDPSEKAAKLISMRTKLLEARSREIELKFQKNKGIITPHKPPPPLPPVIITSLQRNVKMTIAKPSISYSENPNPPAYVAPTPVVDIEKKVKSKQKNDEKDKEKEKKSKRKSKKKKKSSSKRHRKHKSGSVTKKSSSESKASESQELELPQDDNLDRQGPRTPPDNHVLTLEDEQIEWPSHLIRMTITQPSISYSVNPGSMMDESKGDNSIQQKKRKGSSISYKDRKRHRNDEKHSSISSSPSQRTSSPSVHKTEEGALQRKYSSLKQISIHEADLSSDHAWYYNYFVSSYEMDHNQAQHQAYAAIISTGAYESEVFEKWLNSRGLSKLSMTDIEAQKQLYPFSLRESIPSPPGSQQSTSTKPDRNSTSETADQLLESNIDKLITRITRNQVNRDIDDIPNHRIDNSQESIKEDEPETKDEIKTDNSEVVPIGNNHESEAVNAGDPSLGEPIAVKSEEVATQPPVLSPRPDDTVSLHPIQPKFTIIKSQREIVLPNGQVLPPGTIQKIVHPYPRVDSEVLGPYFDLY